MDEPGAIWVGAVAATSKSLGRALAVNSGRWDEKSTPVKSKGDRIDEDGMLERTPVSGEGPDSGTCCPDVYVVT
jgi:hypothetical protein